MIESPIRAAMRSPLQSAMDRIGSAWTPATLFAASEQGVWYDPSDFITMFQDSAGTTPVTAVGQPVGLMLDKSGRGNHATQDTAAARPVLATGIDLDGVDDTMAQSGGGASTTAFMLCAAVKPEGGAASARTIWSDAGTNTGYIVRLNASNQLEMSVGNGTAYTTIATTATVDVGTTYVVTAWDDGTNLNVQVNNGTVASVARPTVSAGTATATLGKDNGAATGFFNGQLISVVQVKNDGGTADERTAAKAYAAGKGGVTL